MRTRVGWELEVALCDAVERGDGGVDAVGGILEDHLCREQVEQEARGAEDELHDEDREALDEREERCRALDDEGVDAPLLEDDGLSPSAGPRCGSFLLTAADAHARRREKSM